MKKLLLGIIITLPFFTQSCYYDKYEELYPASTLNNNCDTTGKFSTNVSKIFQDYCVSCHGASLSSGGYRMDNYNDARSAALSGRMVGAINHQSGFSPMPQGSSKLDSCKIKAIENWIHQGAPNN